MRNLFFCFVLVNLPILVSAQNYSEVNLTDLIRESQQWIKRDGKMSLTWWIPTEYWEVALAGDKRVPPETLEQLEEVFQDYVLICAADITINLNGTMSFKEEHKIRETLLVIDQTGKKYFPLPDDELSSEAITVVETLRPMFAQVLGQMGSGIFFYFFKVKDEKSDNIISAVKPGQFKVVHSSCEFQWNLPLSTLLPPKFCPVDNEKMSGKWNYCPLHGNSLGN